MRLVFNYNDDIKITTSISRLDTVKFIIKLIYNILANWEEDDGTTDVGLSPEMAKLISNKYAIVGDNNAQN